MIVPLKPIWAARIMNQACWKALSVVSDIPVPSGQEPGWSPASPSKVGTPRTPNSVTKSGRRFCSGMTLKIVRTSA